MDVDDGHAQLLAGTLDVELAVLADVQRTSAPNVTDLHAAVVPHLGQPHQTGRTVVPVVIVGRHSCHVGRQIGQHPIDHLAIPGVAVESPLGAVGFVHEVFEPVSEWHVLLPTSQAPFRSELIGVQTGGTRLVARRKYINNNINTIKKQYQCRSNDYYCNKIAFRY